MEIGFGEGKTDYGPGVLIHLDGNELATAIEAYIVAHGVYVSGPRTVSVNGKLCNNAEVYVDPSGFVVDDEQRYTGRGKIEQ